MKVLIVDDKSENLYLLESILKGSGYITVAAQNGAEALALARKDIPDLIITDILMPVMDGFTLCREFKKDEKLYNVPFIFYTATYSDPRDEELALKLGADRFILKPQDPEEFIAIVKELLKEEKKKNIKKTEVPSIPETVILKEYNEVLVRKLEDKMLKLEQSEKEIKKNNILLLKEIEERKQAEKKLRESEEKYRSFFENSMDAIFLTTPDGKTLSANPEACRMFEYTEEELITLGKKGVVDITDPNLNVLLTERALNGKVKGELNMIRKGGTRFPVEISSAIFKNQDGQQFTNMIIRDISERRQAEEELLASMMFIEEIINSIPVRVFWKDKNLIYLGCNSAFARDAGFTDPKEIIGTDDYQMGWREQAELYREDDRSVIESGKSKLLIEEPQTTPGGNKITLLTSKIPLRDTKGEIIGLLGTYIDITERKLAEEKLSESEERFRKTAENLTDVIYDWDIKENLDWYGDIDSIMGYPPGEFPRTIDAWAAIVHPEDKDRVLEALENHVKGAAPYNTEYRVRRRDGEWRWWSARGTALRNVRGEPYKMIGSITDITEIKLSTDALHASEAKFRSYVNDSPQGIFVVDAKGQYIDANNAALNQIGCSKEYLLQKTIVDILPKEELEKGLHHFNKLVKEGRSTSEIKLLKTNGEKIDVILDTVKISDDQFLGFSTDITERKSVESELIASKEKAEEMNRLKSNFLANMSHELRTPLVGILGFADILRQDFESEETKAMADTIYKSAKRLSETLNLILDLSKFESEKRDIKNREIDLVSKAIVIINSFEGTASKKGLTLKSSFSQNSIIINFDERAFHSILNNLINNALKFTSEGSVTTTIILNDDHVEIKVIDTGIGIAEQDYQNIFEEFRQASEGYNRNFEGSGLGLSITKKLVEKFGGTISVESEIEKGTTFTVILPVIDVETKEKELTENVSKIIPESTTPKSVKPIALLVDDDPFVFTVLKRYAKEYIVLETTVDADLAIKMLKNKQYDLIFMDINLRRGMDGKEATKKIRTMTGYESIPIIAATGYAMVGDKEEFLAAGCSHYLSKPFSQEEIVSLLEDALNLV